MYPPIGFTPGRLSLANLKPLGPSPQRAALETRAGKKRAASAKRRRSASPEPRDERDMKKVVIENAIYWSCVWCY